MSCPCSWRTSDSRYITNCLLCGNVLNLIIRTGQYQGKYILPSAWPIQFSVYFLPLYHSISASWLNSHPRDFSSHSSCLLKNPFWTPFPTFSIMSSSHIFSVQVKPSYIVLLGKISCNKLWRKENYLPFFAVTVWFLLGTCSYSSSPQKSSISKHCVIN